MMAHKFVEQSIESDPYLRKQKTKKPWWSLGCEEYWEQLNKTIGYKGGDDVQLLTTQESGNILHTSLEVHMKHNASKLIAEAQHCLAELSCEGLDCSVRLYSKTKVLT
uniref:Uncharacterized protein n=1 Tax=Nelumbo nucifera TaxID=4432 RepID=A0A822Z3W4_NELNU|nr:TPA_asm: hypothetical protein HUJ06_009002 [Nelumbo nucifera]